MTHITLSTDDVIYLVSVLNNERYIGNAYATVAQTLIERLVPATAPDAEAVPSDDEIDGRLWEMRAPLTAF